MRSRVGIDNASGPLTAGRTIGSVHRGRGDRNPEGSGIRLARPRVSWRRRSHRTRSFRTSRSAGLRRRASRQASVAACQSRSLEVEGGQLGAVIRPPGIDGDGALPEVEGVVAPPRPRGEVTPHPSARIPGSVPASGPSGRRPAPLRPGRAGPARTPWPPRRPRRPAVPPAPPRATAAATAAPCGPSRHRATPMSRSASARSRSSISSRWKSRRAAVRRAGSSPVPADRSGSSAWRRIR